MQLSPNENRKPTFALLIPVLNEEASLPSILPKLKPEWVDEILFVDGQSTDRTVEIIKEWGKGSVFVQKKRGLTIAYYEAFPRIKSDFIISFSPDGNSLPEAIPQLIAKINEGYDMVIASRYLPGAGSDDDDIATTFGNWMFTTTINVLFGGKYTDALVMLRAYRKSLVESLKIDTQDPAFEPQLAIRCAIHKCKTADIPAREPKRIGGDRKMRIFVNGWAILKLIVLEWLRMLRNRVWK
jgi:glycosyltransferase involved in cell wall biosynthesis